MTKPWWAAPIAVSVFTIVWPVSVTGAGNVPRTGAVILASNHLGLLDGPVLAGVCPRWPHILVKDSAFRGPVGLVLTAAGQIPVQRGTADRQALGRAMDLLRQGAVVGVFAEGRRGRGDASAVRAGVAWLALRSGAPVVPVACLGTRRTGESVHALPRPRRRLHVVFGAPVRLQEARDGLPGRVALAGAAARVQEVLAAHVRDAAVRTGQELPADQGKPDQRAARGEHG